jgi:hypothetical protein
MAVSHGLTQSSVQSRFGSLPLVAERCQTVHDLSDWQYRGNAPRLEVATIRLFLERLLAYNPPPCRVLGVSGRVATAGVHHAGIRWMNQVGRRVLNPTQPGGVALPQSPPCAIQSEGDAAVGRSWVAWTGRVFGGLAAFSVLLGGCASLTPPDIMHPGTTAHQRQQAQRFDPFPDDSIGPKMEGVRPRDFSDQAPEPSRARWPVPGVRP